MKPKPSPSLDQIWSRTDVRGPNDCWEWRGSVTGTGCAQLNCQIVSRLVWQLSFGTIPHRLCVCHICDNRRCVNPDHLFLGTHAQNMADMINKGRGNRYLKACLSDDWVPFIRLCANEGIPKPHIAAYFGVSAPAIHQVCTRKTHNRIP